MDVCTCTYRRIINSCVIFFFFFLNMPLGLLAILVRALVLHILIFKYSLRNEGGPRSLLVFALVIDFIIIASTSFLFACQKKKNFHFLLKRYFLERSLFMKETSCAIGAMKYLAVVYVAFRATALIAA